MKTPAYYSLTIAANGFQTINENGQFICLLASTGKASILIGLDDERPQLFYPGCTLDCGLRTYHKILLSNPGVGAAVVEIVVGDTRLIDNRDSIALGTMAATLTAILARLAGVAAMTQPTIITLAVTGGAPTVIFAANANRRKVVIEAALTNSGTVYLGSAATHCSDVDCLAMLAPGQAWSDDVYQGGVWGVGNDATQQVVGYQE
jgi:hypothetical protein